MSYTVYIDDALACEEDLQDDGLILTDMKLVSQVNKAGSFEFTIGPENPRYDSIAQMTTTVKVYRDGYMEFYGRVLHVERDFALRKVVFCEGRYAFLNDTILRPYTFQGSVEEYFNLLIENHNSQVEESKQFAAGVCEITDPNDLIVRENSDYVHTRDEMENKLLGLLGGYLVPRYEENTWYLDYLESPGQYGTQKIEFGHNLLDISEYITAEDVFTCLIPLGATDENGTRLDIKSVNDGLDYIESDTGISLYGRIWRTLTWDDVTLPENLKTKGTAALEDAIMQQTTITIGAVDLAAIGVDVDAIKTGWSYRVISAPHGLDIYMAVTMSDLDLQDVSNNTYTFGAVIRTLTDRQTNQVKMSASTIEAQVRAAETKLQETAEKLDGTIIRVNDINEKYAEQRDLEDFQAAYELKVEELETRIRNLEENTN